MVPTPSLLEAPPALSNTSSQIEELARQCLANDCAYSFCFRDILVEYADGVLMLRGRVSSFYLKQVLQTLVAKIEGVRQIDNQVDVVLRHGIEQRANGRRTPGEFWV